MAIEPFPKIELLKDNPRVSFFKTLSRLGLPVCIHCWNGFQEWHTAEDFHYCQSCYEKSPGYVPPASIS